MENIFTKWIIDEIYDKVAEAKHIELTKTLNDEFMGKIEQYRKLRMRHIKKINKLYYRIILSMSVNLELSDNVYNYYMHNNLISQLSLYCDISEKLKKVPKIKEWDFSDLPYIIKHYIL